jgi:hypothetical protein
MKGMKMFGVKGKLAPRYIGLFPNLKKCGTVTYKLDLPPSLQVWFVFTMYFGSLNEILASLVCILIIVRFEFQIQTRFFYLNQAIWHLFCNSKSYIQVYPTKFTVVKIM